MRRPQKLWVLRQVVGDFGGGGPPPVLNRAEPGALRSVRLELAEVGHFVRSLRKHVN